jgi:hypothetical protein
MHYFQEHSDIWEITVSMLPSTSIHILQHHKEHVYKGTYALSFIHV